MKEDDSLGEVIEAMKDIENSLNLIDLYATNKLHMTKISKYIVYSLLGKLYDKDLPDKDRITGKKIIEVILPLIYSVSVDIHLEEKK